MITFSSAQTAENAGMYYKAHLTSNITEYYAPNASPVIGEAVGLGAAHLKLVGEITAEQFEDLLRGLDPTTGATIRTSATHGNVERAGWDMTLSPPKSISIQALVVGDERLIDADRRAAYRAITEVERCALSRQHGGQDWVQTANICAVLFEHYDAREARGSEYGPMPQLHRHAFIVNATQRPDGQWRALEPAQMMKARRFIDAVYLSELARNVKELGYEIAPGHNGAFELATYTRTQILAFSERGQDILAEQIKQGVITPKAARPIRVQTRLPKTASDPATIKANRESLAAANHIPLDYLPVPTRGPITTRTASMQAAHSVTFAVDHATHRDAVPDAREVLGHALSHGIGMTDLNHVSAELASRTRHGNVIADPATYKHPIGRLTTPEMQALERDNLERIRAGMEQSRPILGISCRDFVSGQLHNIGGDVAILTRTASDPLLPDQLQAATLTLTSAHWTTAIEGLAGSSKTTLVGWIARAATDNNWHVSGFGVTTGAVRALEQAGIRSHTVAHAIAATLPPKTKRELWIVDESSLLATWRVNRLLQLAQQRGVERIVFVGDQRQHLAIEAGNPIRQFLTDNMAVASLTNIRRQIDPTLRQAVEHAAAQRIPDALDALEAQHRIIEVSDPATRYQRLAMDYRDALEAKHRPLIVSPSNDERRAINQTVRTLLIDDGRKTIQHDILIPRDLTPTQLRHARSHTVGDVLYFDRASKAIPKRSYWTIIGMDENNYLHLTSANGRTLLYDPRTLSPQVYSTEERTLAVGERIQWRAPDHQHRIANGDFATITKLSERSIQVRFDSGRTVQMPREQARVIDYGYAATSHAAQGATVDRVLIHIDTTQSADLVNDRQFYVSLSRARIDARVYTDSATALYRAASRTQDKALALDVPRPALVY